MVKKTLKQVKDKSEYLLTKIGIIKEGLDQELTQDSLSQQLTENGSFGVLTEADAYFFVALSASKETFLIDLKRDFESWDYGDVSLVDIIQNLIEDGTVLLSERTSDTFKNFSLVDSLRMLSAWSEFESWNTVIYLTAQGDERWESEDWGLSDERAQYLMETNKVTSAPLQ
jgi:hypothetical protein